MNEPDAVRALAALAHSQRLRIFRILVMQGASGLPAGEIACAIGASATAASFHLKELASAGLIGARRDGRHIRYAVAVSAMVELLSFLADDCCSGRPELCVTESNTRRRKARKAKGRS